MGIIRKTQSLTLVLDEFQKDSSAIAATDLIKRLNAQLNKTTIYRILEKLEDDGVLHSFLGSKGTKWYAKYNDQLKSTHTNFHPHFQCNTCGKVECLAIDIQLPKIPNYHIQSSQVLIQGICECCMKDG